MAWPDLAELNMLFFVFFLLLLLLLSFKIQNGKSSFHYYKYLLQHYEIIVKQCNNNYCKIIFIGIFSFILYH